MKKTINFTSIGLILTSLAACSDSEPQVDVQNEIGNTQTISQQVDLYAEYPIFTRKIEFGSYKTDTLQAMLINLATETYHHQHGGFVEDYYPARLWFHSQLSEYRQRPLKHGVIGSPADGWHCVYIGETESGIDCRLETEFKVDKAVRGQGGPYLITTQMFLSPKSDLKLTKGDHLEFSGVITGFDFSQKTEYSKMTLDSLGGNVLSFHIDKAVITELDK